MSDPDNKANKFYIPTEDQINALKKEQPLGWIEEKELKSPKGAKSYYWCWNIAETLSTSRGPSDFSTSAASSGPRMSYNFV